jgi:hypothetical protein
MFKRLWLLAALGLVSCGGKTVSGEAEVVASVSSVLSRAVQIDCGSGSAVAPFAADEDFAGGGMIHHANTIDTSKVTNPAPAAVYQTARTGNFTYTVPGFTAGANSTVRLHFAETFFSNAGSRVFNVSINGTAVLTNFDILKVAVKNQAFIAQFTEPADSSGAYVITFESVVNNSLVSGIEVTGGGSTTNPCQTNNGGCSVNATCASADGGVSCTCNSGFTGNGITCTPVGGGGGGLQIDCGSGSAVAPFAADEDFAGGGTIHHANTIDTSKVTNPAPAAVYQTARTGDFTYTIPGFTAGANSTVRLHFAETFFSTAGSRVFNVSINGTAVLTNFDILKVAVKNQAYIAQFTEPANSSGAYVITFTSVVNNSLASGIEIIGGTNSCLTNNGGCSVNATCTPTGPGTNSCTCNCGFNGNGQTCTNDCSPDPCPTGFACLIQNCTFACK